MAAKTAPAVLDEEIALTDKQIVNEGIARVIEAHGIDVQKNRYKAMRAIAWTAFANAIAEGTFDDLVDEAIANVDNLPSGWEIEKPVREEAAEAPAPKRTPKAAAKAPAKKAAAKAARRRPARSA